MVDYIQNIGATGQMMLRDTGTTVEYWVRAGSGTYNDHLPWAYIANGYWSPWLSFNFLPGGAWQYIGHTTISVSQTVTYKIGNSGTVGLGSGGQISQYISRSSRPAYPSVNIMTITHNSAHVVITDGSNNGAAIDSRFIEYGTDPNGVETTDIPSDGTTTISGLTQKTTYYVWAYTHNTHGNSDYSVRVSFKTLGVPDAPSAPILSNITQVSVTPTINSNFNGGVAVDLRQIRYGVNADAAGSTIVTYTGDPITGLIPGKQYYFWAREHNSIGYSPWSARSSTSMAAGARIKVGSTWVKAVPYVRDGGVWKVTQPWVRVAGVWKETI